MYMYSSLRYRLTENLSQSQDGPGEDTDGDEELMPGAERSSQVEGCDLRQVHGRQTSGQTYNRMIGV